MFKAIDNELKRILFIGKRKTGKALLVKTLLQEDLIYKNNTDNKPNFVESLSAKIGSNKNDILVDIVDINGISNSGETYINYYFPQISKADFAIIVLDANHEIDYEELELINNIKKIALPFFIVVNKIELGVSNDLLYQLREINAIHFEISCKENAGIDFLKARLLHSLPVSETINALDNLVNHGDFIFMVVPDDLYKIRKGIYTSQIQLVKQSLSEDAVVVITKKSAFKKTLMNFKYPPSLIIADSKIIKDINKIISAKIKLTTYSILMTAQKGSLSEFVKGLKHIEKLKDNDKVLIAEACFNHPPGNSNNNNIKIARWLKLYTKKKIDINIIRGNEFPENLKDYKLIIHCSGCLLYGKFYNSKINEVRLLNIPITNYGILLAFIHEVFPRVIEPFNLVMNENDKRKPLLPVN